MPEFEPPFLLLKSGISMPFFSQLKNLGRIPDESQKSEVSLSLERVCLCALTAAQELDSVA